MLNLVQRLHALFRDMARSNSRSFKGQFVLDAMDGALDGGCDTLDAALDGDVVREEVDVALPSGRPLGSLSSYALFGARDAHGKGGERAHAGSAEEDVLGHTGGGDADGHFGGCLGVCLKGDAVVELVGYGRGRLGSGVEGRRGSDV